MDHLTTLEEHLRNHMSKEDLVIICVDLNKEVQKLHSVEHSLYQQAIELRKEVKRLKKQLQLADDELRISKLRFDIATSGDN